MKLRNKKTGKVQTCDMVVITDEKLDGAIASLNKHAFIFRSIEQFNDQYEAYKLAEPLIKDEKIRKAVRAWAEANGYSLVKVGYDMASEPNDSNVQIHFEGTDIVDEDKYGVHTIAELCGKEEE